MQIARSPITLRQAQAQFRAKVMQLSADYITCPCCGSCRRAYGWLLYKTAVRCLATYYKLGADNKPVLSTDVLATGHPGKGDEARLQDFKLIKKMPGEGGRAYSYMLTKLGVDFLMGEASVPLKIWLYGKHNIVSETEERVFIHQIDQNFDREAMLRGDW